jgi:hypothetical protein
MTEKPELEELPIGVLREIIKEKGINFKSTKKDDLIAVIRAGEAPETKREIKRAPRLEDQEKKVKVKPIVSKAVKQHLDELSKNGLTWSIDEESGCINFKRDIETCANLDQSDNNIISTAREAFARAKPPKMGWDGIPRQI